MLTLANLVTLLRVLLTPVVAVAIIRDHFGAAIWWILGLGLTDILDGALARGSHSASRFGAYFDPVADKILLATVYVMLGVSRVLPWWIVILVFARDALILAMAIYGLLFTSFRKFPPSVWGKISTLLQIAAAMIVMGAHIGIHAPVRLALTLMIAATAWSGIHYAWRGITLLRTA